MKKVSYIILWIFLGLILSFGLHAIIEVIYLGWAQKHNVIVSWALSGSCALPLWLIILLPVLGMIFGIYCGLKAWQKIYVEKVRGDKPKFFRK
ncbi:MAG: hypothetical protein WCV58_03940 [Patescibacteria group bacterium]|jgi:hypothetical protein